MEVLSFEQDILPIIMSGFFVPVFYSALALSVFLGLKFGFKLPEKFLGIPLIILFAAALLQVFYASNQFVFFASAGDCALAVGMLVAYVLRWIL